ncbi:MAG TPA: FAD:protein FMN transferase, partial [Frankiaceae bacterium]|nr:FAD:protein FMN transferase [Frankiaceae bacterium]
MGTVFSFDIRDPGDWADALAEAVAWLHEVDETFSTYRADSAVSRLGRGELSLRECSAQVQEVFALCEQVCAESKGAFSMRAAGRLDPSGMVKGWAIERASDLLAAHGCRNHAVNGGGDIQMEGESAPGQPWRIGIADPQQSQRVLTVVAGRNLAVATSGTAERGPHIVDPRTGNAAVGLASVTVVGRQLTLVDAYATAAFVMGPDARAWLESLDGYEGLVVHADGSMESTSGWSALTRS